MISRRLFFQHASWFAALPAASFSLAAELGKTPRMTEGPFYPDKLPLDTDNDLLIVNDDITPAIGEVTLLSGRILDAHGEPIRNALVEIWQADNTFFGQNAETLEQVRAESASLFVGP